LPLSGPFSRFFFHAIEVFTNNPTNKTPPKKQNTPPRSHTFFAPLTGICLKFIATHLFFFRRDFCRSLGPAWDLWSPHTFHPFDSVSSLLSQRSPLKTQPLCHTFFWHPLLLCFLFAFILCLFVFFSLFRCQTNSTGEPCLSTQTTPPPLTARPKPNFVYFTHGIVSFPALVFVPHRLDLSFLFNKHPSCCSCL